jgi:hypothetical protein
MSFSSESARRLSDKIKQAIDDNKITNAEYEEIMNIATEDHIIDSQEKRLLQELQLMIENGTVKRVP